MLLRVKIAAANKNEVSITELGDMPSMMAGKRGPTTRG